MKTMLITGGAGFIGRAACARYKDKYYVIAVDDMSRSTTKQPEGVEFFRSEALAWFVNNQRRLDIVLHLSAQVSVMASIANPYNDFIRNAVITHNLSERSAKLEIEKFIYASTNKVYGERGGMPASYPIEDSEPIAPQTPYGISKATGGLYVREFLPDTGYDFRQSCIYGEGQEGTEDQGWVGYISRQIQDGKPVICYGDGSQVRDLLHVDDLLAAYDMALEDKIPAGSYTVGGGRENAFSFKFAVETLGGVISEYRDWRPHDQHYCVMASDTLRRAGWKPAVKAIDRLRAMGAQKVAAGE